MNYWLFKSDPDTYGLDELARDRETTWDGVTNPQALGFIRQMKRGDKAFIYHSGKDKSIVGACSILKDSYSPPTDATKKLAVVDVKFTARAETPVPLSRIKADPSFADFLLVRSSRLSVMPVTPAQWKKLTTWAGLPA